MNHPLPPMRPAPEQIRIGLWGAPGSGKTTFLAALSLALTRHREANPDTPWLMSGIDDFSQDFLNDAVTRMTDERAFPQATQTPQGISFQLRGSRFVERKSFGVRRQPVREQLDFELEVLDVPGGMYKHRKQPSAATTASDGLELAPGRREAVEDSGSVNDQRLLDHLDACDGILYLFDPEHDRNEGDSFSYFHPVLQKLTRSMMEKRTHLDTQLPHHVAVCVTKFDQPDIYGLARRRGYTVQTRLEPHMPHVPNELAELFFKDLCADPLSNTRLLQLSLAQHFKTLQYFVTSAVGFYTNGKRFQLSDSRNVLRQEAGPDGMRIRGQVHPINVFEPLLWLFESIVDAKKARAR